MSDNVSLEALQALVQRTLLEVSRLGEQLKQVEWRLSGRITRLERHLLRQGSETADELQGQIDELAERVSRLEARP